MLAYTPRRETGAGRMDQKIRWCRMECRLMRSTRSLSIRRSRRCLRNRGIIRQGRRRNHLSRKLASKKHILAYWHTSELIFLTADLFPCAYDIVLASIEQAASAASSIWRWQDDVSIPASIVTWKLHSLKGCTKCDPCENAKMTSRYYFQRKSTNVNIVQDQPHNATSAIVTS
jgi:hypothetical protein